MRGEPSAMFFAPPTLTLPSPRLTLRLRLRKPAPAAQIVQFATAIMRLAVAFSTLLLFACAPIHTTPPPENPSSRVRLSAERVSQQTVRLTLDNGERHPIGYNLCTSRLQRRAGTTWAAVQTDDMCTMQWSTLNPGADATFQKSLSSNIQPGDYRYVASVESPLGTAQTPVASNPFTLP